MKKLERPLGLIRYDTEEGFAERKRQILRPRVVLYGLLLAFFCGALVWRLSHLDAFDAQLIRGALDAPYTTMADQTLVNHLHLRIGNKSREARSYTATLLGAESAKLVVPVQPFPVAGDAIATMPVFIQFPRELLGEFGSKKIEILIADDLQNQRTLEHTLLGPGR